MDLNARFRTLSGILAFLVIAICFSPSSAAPLQSNGTKSARDKGCYYLSTHYENGERIDTKEACLNCTCVNSMLMCYLRVCPFVKPVGEDCIIERHEGDCCPKIWCPEVIPAKCSDPSGEPHSHDPPGCYLGEQYYPDGAQLPRDPKRSCEVCYCIRNSTACVMQECELKVEGCSPVYRDGQCCPCRYNCTYEEATTAPPGVTLTELAEGCVTAEGVHVADGAAVNSSNPCEHCYCMRNEVVCAIQECQAPGDNCKPLPAKSGQCCPDRYECPMTSTDLTTDFTSVTPTHSPGTRLTFASVFTPSTAESTDLGKGEVTSTPKTDVVSDGQQTTSVPLETVPPTPDATSEPSPVKTDQTTEEPEVVDSDEQVTQESIEGRHPTTLEHTTSTTRAPFEVADHRRPVPVSSTPTSTITHRTKGRLPGTAILPKGAIPGEKRKATTLTVSETSTTTRRPHRRPPIKPMVMPIPGEGICRVGRVVFQNGESVPSSDPCKHSCQCINSVILCKQITCETAPAETENCKVIRDPLECCPVYKCRDTALPSEPSELNMTRVEQTVATSETTTPTIPSEQLNITLSPDTKSISTAGPIESTIKSIESIATEEDISPKPTSQGERKDTTLLGKSTQLPEETKAITESDTKLVTTELAFTTEPKVETELTTQLEHVTTTRLPSDRPTSTIRPHAEDAATTEKEVITEIDLTSVSAVDIASSSETLPSQTLYESSTDIVTNVTETSMPVTTMKQFTQEKITTPTARYTGSTEIPSQTERDTSVDYEGSTKVVPVKETFVTHIGYTETASEDITSSVDQEQTSLRTSEKDTTLPTDLKKSTEVTLDGDYTTLAYRRKTTVTATEGDVYTSSDDAKSTTAELEKGVTTPPDHTQPSQELVEQDATTPFDYHETEGEVLDKDTTTSRDNETTTTKSVSHKDVTMLVDSTKTTGIFTDAYFTTPIDSLKSTQTVSDKDTTSASDHAETTTTVFDLNVTTSSDYPEKVEDITSKSTTVSGNDTATETVSKTDVTIPSDYEKITELVTDKDAVTSEHKSITEADVDKVVTTVADHKITTGMTSHEEDAIHKETTGMSFDKDTISFADREVTTETVLEKDVTTSTDQQKTKGTEPDKEVAVDHKKTTVEISEKDITTPLDHITTTETVEKKFTTISDHRETTKAIFDEDIITSSDHEKTTMGAVLDEHVTTLDDGKESTTTTPYEEVTTVSHDKETTSTKSDDEVATVLDREKTTETVSEKNVTMFDDKKTTEKDLVVDSGTSSEYSKTIDILEIDTSTEILDHKQTTGTILDEKVTTDIDQKKSTLAVLDRDSTISRTDTTAGVSDMETTVHTDREVITETISSKDVTPHGKTTGTVLDTEITASIELAETTKPVLHTAVTFAPDHTKFTTEILHKDFTTTADRNDSTEEALDTGVTFTKLVSDEFSTTSLDRKITTEAEIQTGVTRDQEDGTRTVADEKVTEDVDYKETVEPHLDTYVTTPADHKETTGTEFDEEVTTALVQREITETVLVKDGTTVADDEKTTEVFLDRNATISVEHLETSAVDVTVTPVDRKDMASTMPGMESSTVLDVKETTIALEKDVTTPFDHKEITQTVTEKDATPPSDHKRTTVAVLEEGVTTPDDGLTTKTLVDEDATSLSDHKKTTMVALDKDFTATEDSEKAVDIFTDTSASTFIDHKEIAGKVTHESTAAIEDHKQTTKSVSDSDITTVSDPKKTVWEILDKGTTLPAVQTVTEKEIDAKDTTASIDYKVTTHTILEEVVTTVGDHRTSASTIDLHKDKISTALYEEIESTKLHTSSSTPTYEEVDSTSDSTIHVNITEMAGDVTTKLMFTHGEPHTSTGFGEVTSTTLHGETQFPQTTYSVGDTVEPKLPTTSHDEGTTLTDVSDFAVDRSTTIADHGDHQSITVTAVDVEAASTVYSTLKSSSVSTSSTPDSDDESASTISELLPEVSVFVTDPGKVEGTTSASAEDEITSLKSISSTDSRILTTQDEKFPSEITTTESTVSKISVSAERSTTFSEYAEETVSLTSEKTTTLDVSTHKVLESTVTQQYELAEDLDCTFNGTAYKDGQKIDTIDPCEHCFCALGQLTCSPVICRPPPSSCYLLKPREGECCSDTAECPHEDGTTTTISLVSSTHIPEEYDQLTSIKAFGSTISPSTDRYSTTKAEFETYPTSVTSELLSFPEGSTTKRAEIDSSTTKVASTFKFTELPASSTDEIIEQDSTKPESTTFVSKVSDTTANMTISEDSEVDAKKLTTSPTTEMKTAEISTKGVVFTVTYPSDKVTTLKTFEDTHESKTEFQPTVTRVEGSSTPVESITETEVKSSPPTTDISFTESKKPLSVDSLYTEKILTSTASEAVTFSTTESYAPYESTAEIVETDITQTAKNLSESTDGQSLATSITETTTTFASETTEHSVHSESTTETETHYETSTPKDDTLTSKVSMSTPTETETTSNLESVLSTLEPQSFETKEIISENYTTIGSTLEDFEKSSISDHTTGTERITSIVDLSTEYSTSIVKEGDIAHKFTTSAISTFPTATPESKSDASVSKEDVKPTGDITYDVTSTDIKLIPSTTAGDKLVTQTIEFLTETSSQEKTSSSEKLTTAELEISKLTTISETKVPTSVSEDIYSETTFKQTTDQQTGGTSTQFISTEEQFTSESHVSSEYDGKLPVTLAGGDEISSSDVAQEITQTGLDISTTLLPFKGSTGKFDVSSELPATETHFTSSPEDSDSASRTTIATHTRTPDTLITKLVTAEVDIRDSTTPLQEMTDVPRDEKQTFKPSKFTVTASVSIERSTEQEILEESTSLTSKVSDVPSLSETQTTDISISTDVEKDLHTERPSESTAYPAELSTKQEKEHEISELTTTMSSEIDSISTVVSEVSSGITNESIHFTPTQSSGETDYSTHELDDASKFTTSWSQKSTYIDSIVKSSESVTEQSKIYNESDFTLSSEQPTKSPEQPSDESKQLPTAKDGTVTHGEDEIEEITLGQTTKLTETITLSTPKSEKFPTEFTKKSVEFATESTTMSDEFITSTADKSVEPTTGHSVSPSEIVTSSTSKLLDEPTTLRIESSTATRPSAIPTEVSIELIDQESTKYSKYTTTKVKEIASDSTPETDELITTPSATSDFSIEITTQESKLGVKETTETSDLTMISTAKSLDIDTETALSGVSTQQTETSETDKSSVTSTIQEMIPTQQSSESHEILEESTTKTVDTRTYPTDKTSTPDMTEIEDKVTKEIQTESNEITKESITQTQKIYTEVTTRFPESSTEAEMKSTKEDSAETTKKMSDATTVHTTIVSVDLSSESSTTSKETLISDLTTETTGEVPESVKTLFTEGDGLTTDSKLSTAMDREATTTVHFEHLTKFPELGLPVTVQDIATELTDEHFDSATETALKPHELGKDVLPELNDTLTGLTKAPPQTTFETTQKDRTPQTVQETASSEALPTHTEITGTETISKSSEYPTEITTKSGDRLTKTSSIRSDAGDLSDAVTEPFETEETEISHSELSTESSFSSTEISVTDVTIAKTLSTSPSSLDHFTTVTEKSIPTSTSDLPTEYVETSTSEEDKFTEEAISSVKLTTTTLSEDNYTDGTMKTTDVTTQEKIETDDLSTEAMWMSEVVHSSESSTTLKDTVFNATVISAETTTEFVSHYPTQVRELSSMSLVPKTMTTPTGETSTESTITPEKPTTEVQKPSDIPSTGLEETSSKTSTDVDISTYLPVELTHSSVELETKLSTLSKDFTSTAKHIELSEESTTSQATTTSWDLTTEITTRLPEFSSMLTELPMNITDQSTYFDSVTDTERTISTGDILTTDSTAPSKIEVSSEFSPKFPFESTISDDHVSKMSSVAEKASTKLTIPTDGYSTTEEIVNGSEPSLKDRITKHTDVPTESTMFTRYLSTTPSVSSNLTTLSYTTESTSSFDYTSFPSTKLPLEQKTELQTDYTTWSSESITDAKVVTKLSEKIDTLSPSEMTTLAEFSTHLPVKGEDETSGATDFKELTTEAPLAIKDYATTAREMPSEIETVSGDITTKFSDSEFSEATDLTSKSIPRSTATLLETSSSPTVKITDASTVLSTISEVTETSPQEVTKSSEPTSSPDKAMTIKQTTEISQKSSADFETSSFMHEMSTMGITSSKETSSTDRPMITKGVTKHPTVKSKDASKVTKTIDDIPTVHSIKLTTTPYPTKKIFTDLTKLTTEEFIDKTVTTVFPKDTTDTAPDYESDIISTHSTGGEAPEVDSRVRETTATISPTTIFPEMTTKEVSFALDKRITDVLKKIGSSTEIPEHLTDLTETSRYQTDTAEYFEATSTLSDGILIGSDQTDLEFVSKKPTTIETSETSSQSTPSVIYVTDATTLQETEQTEMTQTHLTTTEKTSDVTKFIKEEKVTGASGEVDATSLIPDSTNATVGSTVIHHEETTFSLSSKDIDVTTSVVTESKPVAHKTTPSDSTLKEMPGLSFTTLSDLTTDVFNATPKEGTTLRGTTLGVTLSETESTRVEETKFTVLPGEPGLEQVSSTKVTAVTVDSGEIDTTVISGYNLTTTLSEKSTTATSKGEFISPEVTTVVEFEGGIKTFAVPAVVTDSPTIKTSESEIKTTISEELYSTTPPSKEVFEVGTTLEISNETEQSVSDKTDSTLSLLTTATLHISDSLSTGTFSETETPVTLKDESTLFVSEKTVNEVEDTESTTSSSPLDRESGSTTSRETPTVTPKYSTTTETVDFTKSTTWKATTPEIPETEKLPTTLNQTISEEDAISLDANISTAIPITFVSSQLDTTKLESSSISSEIDAEKSISKSTELPFDESTAHKDLSSIPVATETVSYPDSTKQPQTESTAHESTVSTFAAIVTSTEEGISFTEASQASKEVTTEPAAVSKKSVTTELDSTELSTSTAIPIKTITTRGEEITTVNYSSETDVTTEETTLLVETSKGLPVTSSVITPTGLKPGAEGIDIISENETASSTLSEETDIKLGTVTSLTPVTVESETTKLKESSLTEIFTKTDSSDLESTTTVPTEVETSEVTKISHEVSVSEDEATKLKEISLATVTYEADTVELNNTSPSTITSETMTVALKETTFTDAPISVSSSEFQGSSPTTLTSGSEKTIFTETSYIASTAKAEITGLEEASPSTFETVVTDLIETSPTTIKTEETTELAETSPTVTDSENITKLKITFPTAATTETDTKELIQTSPEDIIAESETTKLKEAFTTTAIPEEKTVFSDDTSTWATPTEVATAKSRTPVSSTSGSKITTFSVAVPTDVTTFEAESTKFKEEFHTIVTSGDGTTHSQEISSMTASTEDETAKSQPSLVTSTTEGETTKFIEITSTTIPSKFDVTKPKVTSASVTFSESSTAYSEETSSTAMPKEVATVKFQSSPEPSKDETTKFLEITPTDASTEFRTTKVEIISTVTGVSESETVYPEEVSSVEGPIEDETAKPITLATEGEITKFMEITPTNTTTESDTIEKELTSTVSAISESETLHPEEALSMAVSSEVGDTILPSSPEASTTEDESSKLTKITTTSRSTESHTTELKIASTTVAISESETADSEITSSMASGAEVETTTFQSSPEVSTTESEITKLTKTTPLSTSVESHTTELNATSTISAISGSESVDSEKASPTSPTEIKTTKLQTSDATSTTEGETVKSTKATPTIISAESELSGTSEITAISEAETTRLEETSSVTPLTEVEITKLQSLPTAFTSESESSKLTESTRTSRSTESLPTELKVTSTTATIPEFETIHSEDTSSMASETEVESSTSQPSYIASITESTGTKFDETDAPTNASIEFDTTELKVTSTTLAISEFETTHSGERSSVTSIAGVGTTESPSSSVTYETEDETTKFIEITATNATIESDVTELEVTSTVAAISKAETVHSEETLSMSTSTKIEIDKSQTPPVTSTTESESSTFSKTIPTSIIYEDETTKIKVGKTTHSQEITTATVPLEVQTPESKSSTSISTAEGEILNETSPAEISAVDETTDAKDTIPTSVSVEEETAYSEGTTLTDTASRVIADESKDVTMSPTTSETEVTRLIETSSTEVISEGGVTESKKDLPTTLSSEIKKTTESIQEITAATFLNEYSTTLKEILPGFVTTTDAPIKPTEKATVIDSESTSVSHEVIGTTLTMDTSSVATSEEHFTGTVKTSSAAKETSPTFLLSEKTSSVSFETTTPTTVTTRETTLRGTYSTLGSSDGTTLPDHVTTAEKKVSSEVTSDVTFAPEAMSTTSDASEDIDKTNETTSSAGIFVSSDISTEVSRTEIAYTPTNTTTSAAYEYEEHTSQKETASTFLIKETNVTDARELHSTKSSSEFDTSPEEVASTLVDFVTVVPQLEEHTTIHVDNKTTENATDFPFTITPFEEHVTVSRETVSAYTSSDVILTDITTEPTASDVTITTSKILTSSQNTTIPASVEDTSVSEEFVTRTTSTDHVSIVTEAILDILTTKVPDTSLTGTYDISLGTEAVYGDTTSGVDLTSMEQPSSMATSGKKNATEKMETTSMGVTTATESRISTALTERETTTSTSKQLLTDSHYTTLTFTASSGVPDDEIVKSTWLTTVDSGKDIASNETTTTVYNDISGTTSEKEATSATELGEFDTDASSTEVTRLKEEISTSKQADTTLFTISEEVKGHTVSITPSQEDFSTQMSAKLTTTGATEITTESASTWPAFGTVKDVNKTEVEQTTSSEILIDREITRTKETTESSKYGDQTTALPSSVMVDTGVSSTESSNTSAFEPSQEIATDIVTVTDILTVTEELKEGETTVSQQTGTPETAETVTKLTSSETTEAPTSVRPVTVAEVVFSTLLREINATTSTRDDGASTAHVFDDVDAVTTTLSQTTRGKVDVDTMPVSDGLSTLEDFTNFVFTTRSPAPFPTVKELVKSEDLTESPEANATEVPVTHSSIDDIMTKLTTFFKPSTKPTSLPKTSEVYQQEVLIDEQETTEVVPDSSQPHSEDGYCFFDGHVYQSAEQIPRSDPCEFCFCFRGDIICLQQTCPPPIRGCYATPIQGFCCPRFQCPVQAARMNVSTTTTTPRPKFRPISQKTIRSVSGCQINGDFYQVGQVVRSSSGPCMQCRCEDGGVMKCDPQECQPQAPLMLRMNKEFFRKR